MSETRFQRANFVVANIEAALPFYRDVLGLRLDFVKDSEADSYSYPVFEIPRDRPLRFAVLSTESQLRVLALTEVPGPLERVPPPRRAAIVLETPNIDEVVAGARKLGLHVYDEERLLTHDGRVGREVGIVDLDDNLVVIYYIPAQS